MKNKYNIVITSWKRPIDQCIEVCQAYGSIWLKSMGGKILFANYVTSAVISSQVLKANSPKQIEAIKRVKEKLLVDHWEENMQDVVGRRMGVLGYRGYFKIVAIYAKEPNKKKLKEGGE